METRLGSALRHRADGADSGSNGAAAPVCDVTDFATPALVDQHLRVCYYIEVKAEAELEPADFVQTLSYLKASGYKAGLLINFGAPKPESKRLVN